MNREEAIRKLEYSKKAYQTLIDEKVDSGKLVGKDVKGEWKADTPLDEAYKSMIDAHEMAIKALEQESCGDAISRQAVLDLVDSYSESRSNVEDVTQDIISDIVALPPVNLQSSGDLISRQSAIFLASDLKQDLPDDEHLADMVMAHNEGVLEYQAQLSLLPSVTPQPKTSHWIDDKCSVCGKGTEDLIDSREWYRNEEPNFCPFCGAKMIELQKSEGEG